MTGRKHRRHNFTGNPHLDHASREVQERFEKYGYVLKCRKCALECKVVNARNLLNFTCEDFKR